MHLSILKLVGAIIVYMKIMHRSWIIKRWEFCISSEKGGLSEGLFVFSHSQNMFCVGVLLDIENCEGEIVLYLSKCDNCVCYSLLCWRSLCFCPGGASLLVRLSCGWRSKNLMSRANTLPWKWQQSQISLLEEFTSCVKVSSEGFRFAWSQYKIQELCPLYVSPLSVLQ